MKNRISESKRKLKIYFKDKIDLLNSNTVIFSKEDFLLFKKIILKSYCIGYISESEFIEITLMIGKNLNCVIHWDNTYDNYRLVPISNYYYSLSIGLQFKF